MTDSMLNVTRGPKSNPCSPVGDRFVLPKNPWYGKMEGFVIHISELETSNLQQTPAPASLQQTPESLQQTPASLQQTPVSLCVSKTFYKMVCHHYQEIVKVVEKHPTKETLDKKKSDKLDLKTLLLSLDAKYGTALRMFKARTQAQAAHVQSTPSSSLSPPPSQSAQSARLAQTPSQVQVHRKSKTIFIGHYANLLNVRTRVCIFAASEEPKKHN